VLSLVLRRPQDTASHTFINCFQYVGIKDNSTLVFIGFSNGAVERVFRMPRRAARTAYRKAAPRLLCAGKVRRAGGAAYCLQLPLVQRARKLLCKFVVVGRRQPAATEAVGTVRRARRSAPHRGGVKFKNCFMSRPGRRPLLGRLLHPRCTPSAEQPLSGHGYTALFHRLRARAVRDCGDEEGPSGKKNNTDNRSRPSRPWRPAPPISAVGRLFAVQ
jgi:hypothetical protein